MRSPLLLAGLVLCSLTLTAAPRPTAAVWPHVPATNGMKISAATEDGGEPLKDILAEYARLTATVLSEVLALDWGVDEPVSVERDGTGASTTSGAQDLAR